MDNDEQPNADGYYEDPLGEEDIPVEGRDITVADPTEDVMLEISNMTINHHIFNGSTNLFVNQRCPQLKCPGSHRKAQSITDLCRFAGCEKS